MKSNKFHNLCIRMFFRILILDVGCFLISFFALAISESPTLRAIIQIIDIIVVVATVYPLCYKAGDIDAPLVTSGNRKAMPMKGLYIGLVSYSPFIITGILLVVSRFTGFLANFVNYYKIINAFYFPFCYSVMPTDYTMAEMPILNVALSALTVLIIPLICMFAYVLGLRRFSFGDKMFYKKSKDDQK